MMTSDISQGATNIDNNWTSTAAVLGLNSTVNSTALPCEAHDVLIQTWFQFDTLHLVRVLVTWLLFCLSMAGNMFVLWSLRGSKSRHFIMFHLALSNLIYTIFVMPSDAVWNTTMEWLAGDVMCRLCQMMKQFGMYASSFMVVVIGADRVTGILSPLPCHSQRKRGYYMVATAWISSLICCLPAGFIFSVASIPTCEGIPIYQCIDFNVLQDVSLLRPYYFFTMCMSFLLPLICTLVSYSLIVCEISTMKERDRVLMGRRHSVNTASIQRAKNRTILMRTLITLTFLVCWGPYYGKGIYDWFIRYEDHTPPDAWDTVMYVVMYLNPVLHPIVFGVFLKEIRGKFKQRLNCARKRFFKQGDFKTVPNAQSSMNYSIASVLNRPRRMSSTSRGSFSSYATGATHLNGSSHVTINGQCSNNGSNGSIKTQPQFFGANRMVAPQQQLLLSSESAL
ncbi:gonadotropin-releasing hormone receptor 1 [Ciona intestinalis]|uniref:Gonadotropin-releasing hormone receptor 1 n=1 Tax=Ciona intestinalis TaxID=7719 RepID=Q3ZK36_CIOIN|nr:gonadotropin-releasing hormone receptor 1 [Ciona intestinalis]AAW70560.1 gonadotropin-releasing hormone receptor 1 [Ciona intestinalis]